MSTKRGKAARQTDLVTNLSLESRQARQHVNCLRDSLVNASQMSRNCRPLWLRLYWVRVLRVFAVIDSCDSAFLCDSASTECDSASTGSSPASAGRSTSLTPPLLGQSLPRVRSGWSCERGPSVPPWHTAAVTSSHATPAHNNNNNYYYYYYYHYYGATFEFYSTRNFARVTPR